MTIEINGTTGVSGVDGSAGTPALQGTDTNTGISFGTDEVAINTGGTERVKVDSSGRVGIGTTTPDRVFHVSGSVSFPARLESTGPNVLLDFKTSGNTALSTTAGAISDAFVVNTNSTERMRVNSSGSVQINGTYSAGLNRISLGPVTSSFSRDGTGALAHIYFENPNGTVGQIYTSGSSTSYVTSSDYRLKENITPVTDGITRLQQLKPSRFNFIADPSTVVDGFIAHEVQDVIPEAISGNKDEVDDDGNPVMQGIDQSKLVPLLTAALQEAITKIETLEGKVAALEGGAS